MQIINAAWCTLLIGRIVVETMNNFTANPKELQGSGIAETKSSLKTVKL
jgi:hypothetical protein